MIRSNSNKRTVLNLCLEVSNLSLSEFSDRIDVSYNYVSQVLRGLNSPNVELEIDNFIAKTLPLVSEKVSQAMDEYAAAG